MWGESFNTAAIGVLSKGVLRGVDGSGKEGTGVKGFSPPPGRTKSWARRPARHVRDIIVREDGPADLAPLLGPAALGDFDLVAREGPDRIYRVKPEAEQRVRSVRLRPGWSRQRSKAATTACERPACSARSCPVVLDPMATQTPLAR